MIGPGILEANDPPIRMVWVTAANPVAMLPQSKTVAQALESREMTVVVDSFLTDTAQHAHVVLPTTTMLEEDDLLGSYGHHWLAEMRPITEAPGDIRSDIRNCAGSSRTIGRRRRVPGGRRHLETPLAFALSQTKARRLNNCAAVRCETPSPLPLLFEGRIFNTPSGRANLITDVEPLAPQATTLRPLLLMAISTKEAQGSQWVEGQPNGTRRGDGPPPGSRGI